MCQHIMKHELRLRSSKDQEIKKYYESQVTYCRRISICIFAATILSIGPWTIVSFMQVFASEDMSIFTDQPFMYDMWYPFEREKHMPWLILINLWYMVVSVLLNIATQVTFLSLMIYASTRLKLLQIRLRNFDRLAQDIYGGDVLYTVTQLIGEHQVAISFVESLNGRAKYVMLLEFVLNSISLASVTIQVVAVHTVSGLLTIISILLLVLFQIFIWAWCANEIVEQSLKVADAIWLSNWYEQTKEVKVLLLIMLMRAQKPVGIFTGPFFQMTTKTALMNVRIAYSYMSVMMQNYKH